MADGNEWIMEIIIPVNTILAIVAVVFMILWTLRP